MLLSFERLRRLPKDGPEHLLKLRLPPYELPHGAATSLLVILGALTREHRHEKLLTAGEEQRLAYSIALIQQRFVLLDPADAPYILGASLKRADLGHLGLVIWKREEAACNLGRIERVREVR